MTPERELRLRDVRARDAEPMVHGGHLDFARRMFPDAPQPWIDLSTGINPSAYPLPDIALHAWTRLPDAEALARLEQIAGRAYRAPSHIHVVAGAGSQSFIQWLPHLTQARRVAILGFAYAEHAARWRASGAAVEEVATLEQLLRADVAVVVNPNNPDGRLTAPEDLADLSLRMARKGGLLVVDEAFMDMTPLYSLAPHMRGEAIVLRSLGKAYGLPGVRLGFALCGKEWAARLRDALGPWSVAGPALAVGAAALEDSPWLAESAARLDAAALRLDKMLREAGFEILGGTALFRLAGHERSGSWFRRLAECGIWTRNFVEKPAWLRFGVPGDEDAWKRLERALDDGP
jgi:cobalamin biosynthetic protein CobC